MTAYHRFFTTEANCIDDTELALLVAGLGADWRLQYGVLCIGESEVGLMEINHYDDPVFTDDLDLVLRQAAQSKQCRAVIDRLRRSRCLVHFQPLADVIWEQQQLLWNQLFAQFPHSVLVLESGRFIDSEVTLHV